MGVENGNTTRAKRERAHHRREGNLTLTTDDGDISLVELVRHQLVHRASVSVRPTRSSCEGSHGRQMSSAVLWTSLSCPDAGREDELDHGLRLPLFPL